jgi:hypothetical protein
LPITGSLSLQDSTAVQQNHLVAECIPAQVACKGAVVQGTQERQAWVWSHWKEYLNSIRIKDDDYLKNFSWEQQHSIIRAFALAVREARFSKLSYE